jgi:mono/diheme cytochrome c family protein
MRTRFVVVTVIVLGPEPLPQGAGHAPGRHAEASDGELYWIIENGVRLTGMPAWGDGSGNDQDTWTLVHVVRHLTVPDHLHKE